SRTSSPSTSTSAVTCSGWCAPSTASRRSRQRALNGLSPQPSAREQRPDLDGPAQPRHGDGGGDGDRRIGVGGLAQVIAVQRGGRVAGGPCVDLHLAAVNANGGRGSDRLQLVALHDPGETTYRLELGEHRLSLLLGQGRDRGAGAAEPHLQHVSHLDPFACTARRPTSRLVSQLTQDYQKLSSQV